jgi:hypothetical protein
MSRSDRPSSASTDPRQQAPVPPWWRVGMVWLVVGLPAAAVVGSLTAATIAIKGADKVVRTPQNVVATPAGELPANLGRNHVSTPR